MFLIFVFFFNVIFTSFAVHFCLSCFVLFMKVSSQKLLSILYVLILYV